VTIQKEEKMNSKIDFINGDTNKSLIRMFAPLMVAMIMLMIYNMVFTSIFRAFGDPMFQMNGMDYLKSSLIIGGALIAVISVLVILFSGQLTAIFGQGAEVAKVVSRFFSIISSGYVLYMLTSCMQGYITGIGKPEMAMILLVLYYIVFRIPDAYIMKLIFGLNGVWFAFLISHILSVLVAFIMVSYIQKTYSVQDRFCLN
jgi:Na+-driven multidrug efflux pump